MQVVLNKIETQEPIRIQPERRRERSSSCRLREPKPATGIVNSPLSCGIGHCEMDTAVRSIPAPSICCPMVLRCLPTPRGWSAHVWRGSPANRNGKFPPLAPDFVVELTSPADRQGREAGLASGRRSPHRLRLPAAPRGGKTSRARRVEGRGSRRRICARTGRDLGPGYLTALGGHRAISLSVLPGDVAWAAPVDSNLCVQKLPACRPWKIITAAPLVNSSTPRLAVRVLESIN